MKSFVKLYIDSYRGISQPAWMLTLIMLINRSGAMVLPFLGVYMTQSLGFDLKEAGIVLSCFGIGAVAGSWIGGWLTDKIGNFRVQFFSLFLSAPIFFILPQLKTPFALSLGVLVLSLITETFRPANSVSIASYAKPENITRAFSLNRMAMNLGFSIGPALGGLLAAISYSWLFYGNGLSAASAGILFYLYFRNRKANKRSETSSQTNEQTGDKSPWKDGPFVLFSFLCCLYAICFFQLLSTLPLFYRSEHHLSEWNIGVILAFSGLVVFSLEMLLVHIAQRRMNSTQVIVLGTILCGASFVLLLIPDSLAILYLSMFILCISEILAMPFMATVTMQRASSQKQGAYMGLNALAFSMAHILSPYLGTRIAANFGFSALWWSTGLLTAVTAAGFWLVMKKWFQGAP